MKERIHPVPSDWLLAHLIRSDSMYNISPTVVWPDFQGQILLQWDIRYCIRTVALLDLVMYH